MKNLFLIVFGLSLSGLSLAANWDTQTIDSRVQTLLGQMTLEEKAGQLSQYAMETKILAEMVKSEPFELATKGKVGSILYLKGAKACNEFQRQVPDKSRLELLILFGLDVIHGYRTVYPIPLGLASSWDPELAASCARMAGVECSSEGIRWTFSPMVDIARDDRWGRITEGNGEDPFLGGILAAAWVRGNQGTNLADPSITVILKSSRLGRFRRNLPTLGPFGLSAKVEWSQLLQGKRQRVGNALV